MFNDKNTKYRGIAWLSGVLCLIASSVAVGKNGTSLGKISYSGSACPAGTVNVKLDNPGSRLTIGFRRYSVASKGRNKKGALKRCTIQVPIKVPAGWSVSLQDANYRGNVVIPSGGSAKLVSTYSFSGRRGKSFRVNFSGPRSQKYQLKDPLSSLASVWSGCGQTAMLRITSSMRVKSSSQDSTSQNTNSFDTRLKFRRCR